MGVKGNLAGDVVLVRCRGPLKQNRSTEGCSKLKRSEDMTSSGKNGLNIRKNAGPKWDRTRCPEEKASSVSLS